MAFKSSTHRSSGAGFTSRAPVRGNATSGNGPRQAPAASTGAPQERTRNQWTTICSLYDPYHSAMEPTVVSDLFKSSFCIKLSPVFAQRIGPDDGGTGKKYDHEAASMVVFELPEAITVLRQMQALLAGELYEFTVARLETKRVIFTRAETYYDETHPDAALHAGGIVVAIEEDGKDGKDGNDGRSVVFISRPIFIRMRDYMPQTEDEIAAGVEPVPAEEEVVYPEFSALQAALESYVQNVARVDYSSTRMIVGRGAEREDRTNDVPAPMPTRRAAGGLGAATGAASAVRRPATAVARPATGAASASTDDGQGAEAGGDVPVSGLDGSGTTDDDLDAILGDSPARF